VVEEHIVVEVWQVGYTVVEVSLLEEWQED
jgi:hypothetical protein